MPEDVDGVTTKMSPHTVAETVSLVSGLAAERGMHVFDVIDHSGEAANVGLRLRDTKLVIFGNPKGGTPAMVHQPLAALDLPLKVLVWNNSGQTMLSYTTPAALAARWHLDAESAAPLAGIDSLTDAVINL